LEKYLFFSSKMSGHKRRRFKSKPERSSRGPTVNVDNAPMEKKRLKIEKAAKKLIVILEDCPLETAQVRFLYMKFNECSVLGRQRVRDLAQRQSHQLSEEAWQGSR
jgi:hypothetical protein